MIAGPPWELLTKYWPIYEDAFWRFRQYVYLMPSARVTSWYRTPEHNADVGGAPRSQHLLGLGIDVVVPEADRARALQVARFLGLVAIDEGNHIHIQRYEAGTLPAFLFRGE